MDNTFESKLDIEHESQLPESLILARALEETDDQEEIKSRIGELLERISSNVGSKFTSDVASLYQAMQSEKCLARVERLSRVLETVELGVPLHISEEIDSHHANAVVPLPEGIKIAFGEAQTRSPLRVVVGFGKTLIGFKTDNLSVEEIDFTESKIRDTEERKFLCRHVSGDLRKDDIRYLVLRIPYNLVDKKYLTEDEQKRSRPFVFRGMHLGA